MLIRLLFVLYSSHGCSLDHMLPVHPISRRRPCLHKSKLWLHKAVQIKAALTHFFTLRVDEMAACGVREAARSDEHTDALTGFNRIL